MQSRRENNLRESALAVLGDAVWKEADLDRAVARSLDAAVLFEDRFAARVATIDEAEAAEPEAAKIAAKMETAEAKAAKIAEAAQVKAAAAAEAEAAKTAAAVEAAEAKAKAAEVKAKAEAQTAAKAKK